ncbi:hypothetical protein VTN02DRAFT_6090 [Thermoascus thermophilus]
MMESLLLQGPAGQHVDLGRRVTAIGRLQRRGEERLRTSMSVGLPRVVVKGSATVYGQFLEEATVLSVPTYTVHRDERI